MKQLAILALVVWTAMVMRPFPGHAQSNDGSGNASAATVELNRRIEQLEEQLVDMQVVIGTLETLAKGQVSTAIPASMAQSNFDGGSDVSQRLGFLETQIQALTGQVQRLTNQIEGSAGVGVQPQSNLTQTNTFDQTQTTLSAQSNDTGFGSVSVSSEIERDAIGQVIADDDGLQLGGTQRGITTANANPDPSPERLYEQASGYFINLDYGAAEVSFNDFLFKFPNHQLAGNAQYWLGETHFERGQYREAAGAFLKGYKNNRRGPKAQDSLLKLAISLNRLGKQKAACSIFNDFGGQFPNADGHTLKSVKSEQQKAGC